MAAPNEASGDNAAITTSAAAQIIAASADPDHEAHLLARHYSADGEEVISFYELAKGLLQTTIQGSNKPASGFATHAFGGKSVGEIWSAVAPGIDMPSALVAYAKSKRSESATPSATQTPVASFAEATPSRALPETAKTAPLDFVTYCSNGQLFSDYASYYQSPRTHGGPTGSGAGQTENLIGESHKNFMTGGWWTAGSNVNEVDYAACDFSAGGDPNGGTGLWITFDTSNSSNTSVIPNGSWKQFVPPGTHVAQTLYAPEVCFPLVGREYCQPGATFSNHVTFSPNNGDTFAFLVGDWTFLTGLEASSR
jgi:hypothetical protein